MDIWRHFTGHIASRSTSACALSSSAESSSSSRRSSWPSASPSSPSSRICTPSTRRSSTSGPCRCSPSPQCTIAFSSEHSNTSTFLPECNHVLLFWQKTRDQENLAGLCWLPYPGYHILEIICWVPFDGYRMQHWVTYGGYHILDIICWVPHAGFRILGTISQ